MGSVGNNPWAPYNTNKDCSQEICSIYCPQFCYLIFPPPPSEDNNGTFSPLIIAIISVLASALLLVLYYTLVTRFCRGRGNRGVLVEEDRAESGPLGHPCQAGLAGLDEAVIKAIAVRKYDKGEWMVEGSECVVCLNEFQENEYLRVLPKCSHAFHVPCIDKWLASHSVCPLCRANVVALAHPSTQPPEPSSRADNVILTVDDRENTEIAEEAAEPWNEEVKVLRRSASVGMSCCPRQGSSSDTTNVEENGDSVE